MVLLGILILCSERGDVKNIRKRNVTTLSLFDIEALAQKKIYFGHMSVGFDILSGVQEIIKKVGGAKELKVIEIKDSVQIMGSGLYHSKIGRNGSPESKIKAFKDLMLHKELGNKFDIAFFKFCYVDFNKETDVNDVFTEYVKAIEEIQNEYPELKVVHVTIPLTAHTVKIKHYLRNFLVGDIANVRRNEYNQLLCNRFGNNNPLFDLARIESSHLDGSRETFKYKDRKYYCLVREFTNDGGHLNKTGRTQAAIEMLRLLSNIVNMQQ